MDGHDLSKPDGEEDKDNWKRDPEKVLQHHIIHQMQTQHHVRWERERERERGERERGERGERERERERTNERGRGEALR